jgi:hypothetical protein
MLKKEGDIPNASINERRRILAWKREWCGVSFIGMNCLKKAEGLSG